MKTLGQHAIVIGASMGGLLAARVLSNHYERVTLVERDTFPNGPGLRKGTPQAQQPHFLLAMGAIVLEKFFPGLIDELVEHGACDGDTDKILMFQEGGYLCRLKVGVRDVAQSRPLIEYVVRQRVLALANVSAIENCDALGLVTEAGGTRVKGVRIIRRDAGSAEEQLMADLVVDTSGRGSRIPDWLVDLGYAAPEEEKLTVDIVYTSRLYRRQAGHLPGVDTVVIAPTPENPRGGVIIAREDGNWHLMLFGYLGDRTPLDEAGYLEFARSLASPEAYHIIRSAEAVSEPLQYRFKHSQRRHYEKLSRFPEGLLVMGDALCSFNPVYGQGMTVAVLQAKALHESLAAGGARIWQRFFKHASTVVNNAWEIATGSDLKIPGVEGKRTGKIRFVNWYMGKLLKAAQQDPEVTAAFYRVLNFEEAPPQLMHPRTLWRVVRANLRSKTTARAIEWHQQPVHSLITH